MTKWDVIVMLVRNTQYTGQEMGLGFIRRILKGDDPNEVLQDQRNEEARHDQMMVVSMTAPVPDPNPLRNDPFYRHRLQFAD